MLTIKRTILVASCLLTVSAVSYATPPDWLKGTTEEKIKTLADLQPGLGTVMIEYGNRMSTMYYAAKGGNWGMADYQLKEAREIQESPREYPSGARCDAEGLRIGKPGKAGCRDQSEELEGVQG